MNSKTAGNLHISNRVSSPNKWQLLNEHSPRVNNSLSAALYSAQKFGAQYAWVRPRLNGNSRDSTWLEDGSSTSQSQFFQAAHAQQLSSKIYVLVQYNKNNLNEHVSQDAPNCCM